MQLLRDLPCRAAVLEQDRNTSDWRGVRGADARRQRRVLVLARDLAEHANHPIPAKKRDRTDLNGQAIAVL